MIRIIIDTDLRSDCDDAGAFAVAHALADEGHCQLLGAIASTSGPDVVAAIDAINHYFGRPEIPIGLSPIPDTTGDDDYAPELAIHFPHAQQNATAPDSTLLYRRLLAGAPDGSVRLVVIGAQGPIQLLLDSKADAEGDGSIGVSGDELVRRKVGETVIMAGNFTDPDAEEWNVKLNVAAARAVAERWPVPIVYVGFEAGDSVIAGASLSDPETSPVARAYQLYPNTEHGPGLIGGRSSWDLIAVYYAVLGATLGDRRIWNLSAPGRASFTPDARTRFTPDPSGQHRYLIRHMPDPEVAAMLEKWMSRPASGARQNDLAARPAKRHYL